MIVTEFGEDDLLPVLPSLRVLERFITTAAEAIPLRGELSVLLTSDRGIRRLNRRYRGKNKPTDVLSFPAGAETTRHSSVAGDLAISVDTAAQQARLLEHSLALELKVLILHGMLHLAGLDHESDDGAMAARELELRRKLRLPDGLIERNQSPRESTRRAARTRKPNPRKQDAAKLSARGKGARA